jgi:hypothetical protein
MKEILAYRYDIIYTGKCDDQNALHLSCMGYDPAKVLLFLRLIILSNTLKKSEIAAVLLIALVLVILCTGPVKALTCEVRKPS